MGTCSSRTPPKNQQSAKPSLVFLGPSRSGKTSLLYAIKDNGPSISAVPKNYIFPTIMPSMEEFDGINVWDLGGQTKLRQLWWQYTKSQPSPLVLFFINGSDNSSTNDYVDAFKHFAAVGDLRKVALLVVYNGINTKPKDVVRRELGLVPEQNIPYYELELSSFKEKGKSTVLQAYKATFI